MDDTQSQAAHRTSTSRAGWPDWRWLLLLFALVVPLRGWLLVNTEVMARDSVGYIRYALLFDELPWGDVLRSFDQHPAYSLSIWLVSMPLRAWAGETTPAIMQLSAQLVSTLAALVLLVPMFYLGKALWDARIGFGGALLFQFLPLSGHHLSDGVTESLFVMFVAWALLAAVWGVQTGCSGWYVLCGAMTGAAYLTRPEGVLVLGAVGLALILGQVRRDGRQPWSRVGVQTVSLLVPALLVGAFYFVPVGKFTVKPSINRLVANVAATPTPPRPALRAQLWADSFVDVDARAQRLLRGVWALAFEIAGALFYIGCVPALIGLFRQRRSLWRDRALWGPTLYGCMHAGALIVLAITAGYISDRHLMPLIMLVSPLVVVGLVQIAVWLGVWYARQRPGLALRRVVAFIAMALLAVEVSVSLPQTLRRLHHNRAGNHAAGMWLAKHWRPGDVILDDHDWSHYYAGQVFLEHKDPPAPADYEPKCYVVITRSNDPKVAVIRRRWEKRLGFEKSEIVYHWPATKPVEEARVVIHALPRNPMTHPWVVASK